MAPRRLTIDDYEITKEGQVINKNNGHILKPQPNGKGYLRVSIGGKLQFVHRLVAEKYIPNPENKEQVNHKDGNKLNNNVDNLEWSTNLDNRRHAVKAGLHLSGEDCPWSKLDWDKVNYIRENYEMSSKDLAEMFGVNINTINDVKSKRTWNTVVEKIC